MLKETLTSLIGNLYAQYFNLHTFHWNIEGPNFKEMHEFAEGLYEDVFDSIDDFAEEMRQLGFESPLSLRGMLAASDIEELDYVDMETIGELEKNNADVLVSLYKVYQEADKTKELGLVNLTQDRIQTHKKHEWMLKAFQSKV